jgi:hypothetical protein
MTPENVRCLVRRCLEKGRTALQDIGDARIGIEEALGIEKSTRSAPATAVSGKWPLI